MMKLNSRQFSRCFLIRTFSTSDLRASVGNKKPNFGPSETGRCTLQNGIKVASSRPTGALMGACTFLYQAGSRFESDDQLGATHFLRSCSGTSGCAYSTFSKTRVLQQLGSYITVNTDRQSIAFTLRCPAPAFPDVKYYLLDIAARAGFRQHEIDLRKPLIKWDLEAVHPSALVMDLIQKASWGGGLNNSVFCARERIDSMMSSDLDAFTSLNLRADTCNVGSHGLPFEQVMALAEMIESKWDRKEEEPEVNLISNVLLPCEEILLNRNVDFNLDNPKRERKVPGSFFRGGFEYHDLGPDTDTWIAVAVPGCGYNDFGTMMCQNIIAAAAGTGNMLKGQHDEDRVPQPPLGCYAPDMFTTLKPFSISYYDAGLFGILAKTRSSSAYAAAYCAANFLKNIGNLTAAEYIVGRERLKLDVALQDDDCVSISEGMALQGACGVNLDTAQDTFNVLDSLTHSEINATAKTLASKCNKMAVAVVGDVQAVPHDIELRATRL